MGEVVNLRQSRKRRRRAEASDQAAANRARFGRRKDERQAAEAERDRAASVLDQHRLAPDDDAATDEG
jgi:hypothetical protein